MIFVCSIKAVINKYLAYIFRFVVVIMATAEDEKFYIELCKKPIRFEPDGKANNIFFDDANKQVRSLI